MISCAKEVLYIVYMKKLQYLLGTYVIFLFTNKTLHSNLVALTYRKNVPPKAIYFCWEEARSAELITVILCVRNVGVWWFSAIFRALLS